MNAELNLDVIAAAQAGELPARERIVDLYRRPIWAAVHRFLRRRVWFDAEDCAQDIFAKVFRHLQDFDPSRGVKFSTWVYTFARNHCFDILKKKRRPTVSILGRADDGEETGEWIGEWNPPDDPLLSSEFRAALAAALERLPDAERAVFELHAIEAIDFPEVAQRLGLPLGTVKSIHYRALKRMQHWLKGFMRTC